MSYPEESPIFPAAARRRRWPWIAAAAAVLLGAGGATAVALAGGEEPAKKAAAAPTTSTPPVIRLGGGCSSEGVFGKAVDGNGVVCSGGIWVMAPGSEPTSDAAENLTERVGHTYTVSNDDGLSADYTVTKTKTVARDKYGDRPERGVFLLAHVKVEVTSGSEYVCECSFTFVTVSGRSYETAYQDFKGVEKLDSHDVAGGQNLDGWVGFDVPRSALKGGRIAFKPDSFGGQVAYWTL